MGKDASLPDDIEFLTRLARVNELSPAVLSKFPVVDTQWGERRRNPVLYDEWQDTLNKKSPDELDSIARSKVMRSGSSVSKPEKELYNSLIKHVSDIETQFILNNYKKRFIYDIRCGNKIIEFNGSYWHCDPRLFEENYFRKDAKLYAKDIWEKDKIKISLARNRGFDVLVIWELDFKKDKEIVIQKCIDFMKSNINNCSSNSEAIDNLLLKDQHRLEYLDGGNP
jgi:G:T-mismatch repair DNA endonuclease (very short patch repair protein)